MIERWYQVTPRTDIPESRRRLWLAQVVWDYVIDKEGTPSMCGELT